MANPNKNKGTKAETALVRHAQSCGYRDAERIDLGQGWGDVRLRAGLHVQVKNSPTKYSILTPPLDWLRQTWKQGLQATSDLNTQTEAFLVVKPKGIGYSRVGDWHAWLPYVYMRTAQTEEQLIDAAFVTVRIALLIYQFPKGFRG